MSQPTPEEVAAARTKGFQNSLSHRSEADRTRLTESFQRQEKIRDTQRGEFRRAAGYDK